jgi:hypothetical protein
MLSLSLGRNRWFEFFEKKCFPKLEALCERLGNHFDIIVDLKGFNVLWIPNRIPNPMVPPLFVPVQRFPENERNVHLII